ncbi:tRNA dihydrouridine synthase DusB [Holospora undulata]|uniref:tRNA-dihydrouridine synthase n=1 Tax=Holospora undulata HU1 TaxID=1321371 RepID=A0A061JHI7_9PROT|nr:tRNA dihydrouridine synthase DusB [Holospora undulata]ETZ04778.1 putative tRNA-dihydrouridine synthase [Holospora undulata HU1]
MIFRLKLPIWNSSDPLIVLAPMAGVSDLPFRKAVHAFGGISFSVSEMIASQSILRQAQKTFQRSLMIKDEIRVMQLAGNDPNLMAQAARWAADQGAHAIDLNFGCPAKQIAVNSFAGAALMKDEKLAESIFKSVVQAVNIPISVKMRMGWDAKTLNASNLIKLAHNSGISWVTVHGRTRCQFYKDSANWDFISELAKSSPLPIIGNGDIVDLKTAEHHWNTTNISGIMVGRGTYGKPWFLAQIFHKLKTGCILDAPSLSQQHKSVRTHIEDILTFYGKDRGVHILRKHLGWYSKGAAGATAFRQRVFKETCPQNIFKYIDAFYEEQMQGVPV